MNKLIGAIIIFTLGVATGVTYHNEIYLITGEQFQSIDYEQKIASILKPGSVILEANTNPSKIGLCFTPPKHCGHLIAKHIDGAQSSVYMQAYGLTHPEIINSLIQAKQRGVEVKILLDRSNLSQKHSRIKELRQAEIDTTIDVVQGIAHNKVIIIDEIKTITGSFNFTVAADTRNAENVLVIEDRDIAKSYLLNWMNRKSLNKRDRSDEELYQKEETTY